MPDSTIPDELTDGDARHYPDVEEAHAFFDARVPGVPILRGVVPQREEDAPNPLVPERLPGDSTVEGAIRLSCSCGHLVHPLGSDDPLPEHLHLVQDRVAIPPTLSALIAELRYYEYRMTAAGNVKLGAPDRTGATDDLTTALALALKGGQNSGKVEVWFLPSPWQW